MDRVINLTKVTIRYHGHDLITKVATQYLGHASTEITKLVYRRKATEVE